MTSTESSDNSCMQVPSSSAQLQCGYKEVNTWRMTLEEPIADPHCATVSVPFYCLISGTDEELQCVGPNRPPCMHT